MVSLPPKSLLKSVVTTQIFAVGKKTSGKEDVTDKKLHGLARIIISQWMAVEMKWIVRNI